VSFFYLSVVRGRTEGTRLVWFVVEFFPLSLKIDNINRAY